ncbi:MAG TPA: MarR family winged helix-turn-helix transcriptional regulator [Croceibacterium sp.]|jgi:DNA-binding MarR family transcriptional regulator
MAKREHTGHEWGQLANAVGPRVRLLRNALAARSIAALEEFALPTGSLTVLSLIAANPGSNQTALAKAAGVNKSALVGIVDELEKRGLAARDRSASDRRRNHLTVTPVGEATMKAMLARVAGGESKVRDALGLRDHLKLLELLDRANAALE